MGSAPPDPSEELTNYYGGFAPIPAAHTARRGFLKPTFVQIPSPEAADGLRANQMRRKP
jgi:hypothetical protein